MLICYAESNALVMSHRTLKLKTPHLSMRSSEGQMSWSWLFQIAPNTFLSSQTCFLQAGVREDKLTDRTKYPQNFWKKLLKQHWNPGAETSLDDATPTINFVCPYALTTHPPIHPPIRPPIHPTTPPGTVGIDRFRPYNYAWEIWTSPVPVLKDVK